jgi:Uma2 family endonuclease
MSSLPTARLTTEAFLELERAAEEKHEYWHGEVFAMADGSPAHSLVISNIQIALGMRLAGKRCYVFNSDLQVIVRAGELVTYPDITVLCDKPRYSDDRKDTLSNPTLVVEVLSPSTRKTDLGEKAFLYRQMTSLKEILVVDQTPGVIEHHWKLPNGHWELEVLSDPGAAIKMESLGFDLPVSEVYSNIEVL